MWANQLLRLVPALGSYQECSAFSLNLFFYLLLLNVGSRSYNMLTLCPGLIVSVALKPDLNFISIWFIIFSLYTKCVVFSNQCCFWFCVFIGYRVMFCL